MYLNRSGCLSQHAYIVMLAEFDFDEEVLLKSPDQTEAGVGPHNVGAKPVAIS